MLNIRVLPMIMALTMAAVLATGCAKTGSTVPSTPATQATTWLGYLDDAVAIGEVGVAVDPNIPAATKVEISDGFELFKQGTACATSAITSGVTGAALGIKVTTCFTSLDIHKFSVAAQVYLSAADAVVQKLLTFFTPTSAPAVTTAQKKTVVAMQARIKAR